MFHANILTECKQGSKEWALARKQGIGGSDAAAVLTLDDYQSEYSKTPLDVYNEKISEDHAFTKNFFSRRGNAMEPVLREEYSEKTGREVHVSNAILQHPKHKFMLCSLDGYSNDNRIQEFKTATSSRGWGEEGTDQIPQKYLIQTQHNIAVAGADVADVSVSIGGLPPKYYEIPADKEIAEMIIEGEAKFWEKVQARIVPDAHSIEELRAKFTVMDGATAHATPEVEQAVTDLYDLKQLKKELETNEELKKEIIQKFLIVNGATTLLSADGAKRLITWNESKGRSGFDAKAFQQLHPDLYKEFVKTGNPFRTMLIK